MSANKFKKGASLYIALAIMTILLGIALGLSTIFLSQIELIRYTGYSVIAFYAADAGIEQTLMQRADPPLGGLTQNLSNGASYGISVSATCGADNFCIKSIGSYKGTSRAIEIAY